MHGPLHGMKVLDASRYIHGPLAGVLLSDMGAEVVKLELPGLGDPGRYVSGKPDPLMRTPFWISSNRGKKSLTLDLRKPEGQAVLRKLFSCGFDVFLHNFRPGVMEGWSLGYEDLVSDFPGLIYAEASGYGSHGDRAAQGAFDLALQGYTGVMSATGDDDSPIYPVGFTVADSGGAVVLALAIVSALLARERTGDGQKVETSMLGTLMLLQSLEITLHMHTGRLSRRAGGGHPANDGIYSRFKTADGHIVLCGVPDSRWATFCKILDRPDLLSDARFQAPSLRVQNREVLIHEIQLTFERSPSAHWLHELSANGFVSAPVQNHLELVEDPQVRANGYISLVEHTKLGPVSVVGPCFNLSATPLQCGVGPPLLGEHTQEVLSAAGFENTDLAELRRLGVI